MKSVADPTSDLTEAAKFDRLCDLVASGRQLPGVSDLIRGCPFLEENISTDAEAFANAIMQRIGPLDDCGSRLLFAMSELTISPQVHDYLHAAEAFTAAIGTRAGEHTQPEVGAARCHFYAAVSGHALSINKVAAYAVSVAHSAVLRPSQADPYRRAALAWMLAATNQVRLPETWTRQSANNLLAAVGRMCRPEPETTGQVASSRSEQVQETVADKAISPAAVRPECVRHPADHGPASVVTRMGLAMHDDDTDKPGVVVVRQVGNQQSPEGKRVAVEFASVLGETLPLAPLPDLERVRRELVAQFPHAEAVTKTILGTMPGSPHLKLRPTILVGPPGSGKSSYAIRLAGLLGLTTEIYSCGGVSDAALAGTPRRWATGEPSIPLSLICAHRHASPMIILDEVEKAGTSRSNGSLLDALLGLLEPRTARQWRDPYLEAPVDLSHVIWICTANSLSEVPRALLDRCSVIQFPAPCTKHTSALALSILHRMGSARGLDPHWVTPVDDVELRALMRTWQDGSLRTLERLMTAVLSARERFDVRH